MPLYSMFNYNIHNNTDRTHSVHRAADGGGNDSCRRKNAKSYFIFKFMFGVFFSLTLSLFDSR